MQLLRFLRNLLLHVFLVRPACGCGMFTMCLACPKWKLVLQHQYHEEGAAGRHTLPIWPREWRTIHHRDAHAIRTRMLMEPGGEAAYLSRLATAVARYRRQQSWVLMGAGAVAGLAVAIGSAALCVLAGIVALCAFRDEVSGVVFRAGRLLARAWRDAREDRLCFGLIERPAKDM